MLSATIILGILSLSGICCRETMGASLTPVAIEDPDHDLRSFYIALEQTAVSGLPALTRIVQFGDSHTAADIFTGRLRFRFQSDFGEAGPGLIAAGVSYEARGVNGARAVRLLGADQSLFAGQSNEDASGVSDLPDLIVVAYGTNEAGDADFDAAVYADRFTAVLERLRRAAPGASLLVLSPPDRAVRRGRRWTTIGALPALVAAQRRAARRAGAAFWNAWQAMGGAGSIARWAMASPPLAQSDRVHLTRTGYRLLADALHAELMRGYVASISTRERVVQ